MVLLCALLIPFAVAYDRAQTEILTEQRNLTPARGEAFETCAASKVRITVTDGGTPADNVSVSPDRYMWYMPKNGELSLDLLPGGYRFIGICGNRTLYEDCAVTPQDSSTVVIDIGKTPRAPELLMFDIVTREYREFPLEITGADDVTVEGGIDHVRVIRQGGGFSLSVDAARLAGGFYCVTLKARNELGESKIYAGIRLPRNDAIPVYTAEDLNSVRNRLSGNYRLMNDIDMSEIHDWTPIGTERFPFTGVFDGSGFEITGFHSPETISESGESDFPGFGLFGVLEHAEVRNIILREPDITPQSAPATYYSALIAQSYQSLIENCAVIGGTVAPAGCSASGVLAHADNSILTGLFNSADVFCAAPNSVLPNTAGVCGVFIGYGARLANEGDVHGTHLTGGIVGYQNSASLFRCINSGYIWGSTMVGEFPVGAVMQTNELDSVTADCYFTIGSAPTGGNNAANALTPIPEEMLKDAASMPSLGTFGNNTSDSITPSGGTSASGTTEGGTPEGGTPEGSTPEGSTPAGAPDWVYASLDAEGPVPGGIFARQTPSPEPLFSDGKIILPPLDGVLYYYTLNGDNPYTECREGQASAELTLPEGAALTVFAARRGFSDSEIITYGK